MKRARAWSRRGQKTSRRGSAEQRVSKSLTVRPGRPQHLVLHTPRLAGREATDRDFLPAALAIVEEPLSPARMAFVYSLCALLATGLLWACFSKLDVFAVAPGKFQTTGRTKVVQPLQPGKVVAINAKDSDRVKAGDILVQLDPTDAQASETSATAAHAAVRAEIARLNVEIAAAGVAQIDTHPVIAWPPDVPQDLRRREQAVLDSDLAKLAADLANLDAQRTEKIAERDMYTANIAANKNLIELLSALVGMTEKMTKQGWSSQAQYLRQVDPVLKVKETEASLEGQLATAVQEIAVVETQIVQARQTFLAAETSPTRFRRAQRRPTRAEPGESDPKAARDDPPRADRRHCSSFRGNHDRPSGHDRSATDGRGARQRSPPNSSLCAERGHWFREAGSASEYQDRYLSVFALRLDRRHGPQSGQRCNPQASRASSNR